MAEQDHQIPTYHISIEQAHGLVIGDHSRMKQQVPASLPPVSREELLTAIHAASAELRTYPAEIAGVHLERTEVAQIAAWVREANPNERLGMLLDQPGGGKTVVMRDLLEQLKADAIPVLAIKADFLSGIPTGDALTQRLNLPVSVEECLRQLAAEGLVVLLLDQLDALSLALARDQATLKVMLSLLARLRDDEGIRIVASCRTFDLNNDPHLSTIKPDRTFPLQPLDAEQVNRVLHAVGVDPACLLPAHRTLLTTPLHLEIYAKIVTGDPASGTESFRTLQELYEALWRQKIERTLPERPDPAARRDAIYRLVDYMHAHRQITAPLAVLDDHVEAARYLEAEHIIQRKSSTWLFVHQTLFDYCYARRFVAQGRSLTETIVSSSQGLFERSQMVQVLAYLRGSDPGTYRRELTALLSAANLRTHLRLLLLGWFGALPNPTADELHTARQLLRNSDDQARFLQAAGGNAAWFDMLNHDRVPALLQTADEGMINVIISYLGTLIEQRTSQVLAHLRPHLGRSETWDDRIAFCLSRIEHWQSDEALNILCDLLARGHTSQAMHHLALSNPAAGCRALRTYLDRHLDDLLEQEQAQRQTIDEDPHAPYHDDRVRGHAIDRLNWERFLLGDLGIRKLIEQAADKAPEEFLEHLLPWLVRATVALAEWRQDDTYPSEPLFARGWHNTYIWECPNFMRRMATALRHLAQTRPPEFRVLATTLAAVESLAVQRLLVVAYLADPATYAKDIFHYLTTDTRRLNIGELLESPHYDSYRLYGAVFPHLEVADRATLEQLILVLQPAREQRSRDRRGITQLHFLKSVSPDLLSTSARRRRQELERKFLGFELMPPQGVVTRRVEPPIDQAAQKKMSDEAWLGAMRTYDDAATWGVRHTDPFKGGVIELSRAFAKQVKTDPERFYRLAWRFDERISLRYIQAVISGLADTAAPAEWIFALIRHFTPRLAGEARRSVCNTLEKRAEAGIPDDLLDLMTDWARNDPDPMEELWRMAAGESGAPYYAGNPLDHGINTVRGVSIQAVCACALARKPAQVERAFTLLEEVANDPSTAVRACVVGSLWMLLQHDHERTLTIFEQAVNGHPRLLQTFVTHEVIYRLSYRHFPHLRPFIKAMLTDDDDATRQAGARLACLAAFHHPEATPLAEQALQGDVMLRRGAAQVYAHNLGQQDVAAICQEHLLQLMDDPDEQVRTHVGECFGHISPDDLERTQPFIEQFLRSPALMEGAQHLVRYLVRLTPDAPDLVLMTVDAILHMLGNQVVNIQTAAALMERDLVQLVLTVYNYSDEPNRKTWAIDLFEVMLELGSHSAQNALSDWDGKKYPVLRSDNVRTSLRRKRGVLPMITWLHLSDIHFRETQAYNANIVLKTLLDDIKERKKAGLHPDFIIFSGDVAHASQPKEYALARQFFDDVLKVTELDKDRLFLIPGNHDVDRSAISLLAKSAVQTLTDRDTVKTFLDDAGDREIVFKRFRHYRAFISEYLGEERLSFDSTHYFYVKQITLSGLRIAILGLNSAWLCASDQDRNQLIMGEQQVRAALDQAKDAHLCLAVMHHPFDWLKDFDRNDIEPLLCRTCDFVLHGHMHQVGLRFDRTPDTEAILIAAGACYETRQYPNSYNIVQLDFHEGKGTIHLRKYSDRQGGFWTKDVENYYNVRDGIYSFPLSHRLQQTVTALGIGKIVSGTGNNDQGKSGDTAQTGQTGSTSAATPEADPGTSSRITSLRQILDRRLVLEDLRTICFDIGVDYDNLRGEGKNVRIVELLKYLVQRNALQRLEVWLQQNRPDIELP